MKTVTYELYLPWGQDKAVYGRLLYGGVELKGDHVPNSAREVAKQREQLLDWAHQQGYTHVRDAGTGCVEKILVPPPGYTAEELERDNPYNAWLHT